MRAAPPPSPTLPEQDGPKEAAIPLPVPGQDYRFDPPVTTNAERMDHRGGIQQGLVFITLHCLRLVNALHPTVFLFMGAPRGQTANYQCTIDVAGKSYRRIS